MTQFFVKLIGDPALVEVSGEGDAPPDSFAATRSHWLQMYKFAKAICDNRAMRGAKIYQHSGAIKRMYIGFDDEPITRGAVFIRDSKYCFASMHVENARYGAFDENRYISKSADLNRVVPRAVAAFRLGHADVPKMLNEYRRHAAAHVSADTENLNKDMRNLFDAIGRRNYGAPITGHPLAQALIHLANGEAHRISHSFLQQAKEFATAFQNYHDRSSRAMEVYEVFAFRGKYVVTPMLVTGTLDEANIALYSPDTLPDKFKGRLAVLAMVEPGHYVEDVGVRWSPMFAHFVYTGEDAQDAGSF